MPWFRRAPPKSHPIDAALWRSATSKWLFMRGLAAADNERLKALAERFLAGKHFSGTHDLEVTPQMRVVIAAQACILVLELGIEWYEGWSEIIVYPGQFAPEREVMDEDGVMHVTNDPMAGEAWLGGPVVLSYEDVALDRRRGAARAGLQRRHPRVRAQARHAQRRPQRIPAAARGHEPRGLEAGASPRPTTISAAVSTRPTGSRPIGPQAALDALPIDPYASETAGEFFAVASEAFFETPELLAPAYPAVYEQLRLFYRQDPLARIGKGGRGAA